nr:hypothetical protein Itr_chr10CG04420 [Ipomoea trifida]
MSHTGCFVMDSEFDHLAWIKKKYSKILSRMGQRVKEEKNGLLLVRHQNWERCNARMQQRTSV